MKNCLKEIKNVLTVYYLVILTIIFLIIIISFKTNIDYSSSSYSHYNISIKSNIIPNIVWLFWDGQIPKSVRFFLHDLKEKLISYKIIFITNSTVFNYINIKDLPPKLPNLPKANQVDFYKFFLTYNYGGIWMDCTMYLKNETFLNNFKERVIKNNSLLGAFNYLAHPNYHIETGFLVSPRNNLFIKGILKEINICVDIGRTEYMNMRLDEGIIIKFDCVVTYKDNVRKVSPYFYVYVCTQTVLQRDFHGDAKLELLKAEDYMYKIHTYCNWNKYCIKKKWDERDAEDYTIIKFNHNNREYISLPAVEII